MAALGTSKLFGLLNGQEAEDTVDVICTIHEIVWIVVLFKWMNFEIGF